VWNGRALGLTKRLLRQSQKTVTRKTRITAVLDLVVRSIGEQIRLCQTMAFGHGSGNGSQSCSNSRGISAKGGVCESRQFATAHLPRILTVGILKGLAIGIPRAEGRSSRIRRSSC
jgi:hypothetical protein